MQTTGLSASKAELAKQLSEQFADSSKLQGKALEELAQLDESGRVEVLGEVERIIGEDAYRDVFLPQLINVGTAVGAFVETQNAREGQGAARPEDAITPAGSRRNVELRAAEQAARAQARIDRSDEGMGLMNSVSDLRKQLQTLRADVAASDLPDDIKKKFGATIDSMNVDGLEKEAARYGMAHTSLNSWAARMREMGQGAKGNLALQAFERNARREMEKMAYHCRDTDRGATILRLLSSNNLSIDALIMAVMLLFYEDSADKLREQMAELKAKKDLAKDLKKQHEALAAAETPDALETALADIAHYEAATALQEAVDEALDTTSPDGKTGKPNETDEAKVEAQKARSGEASGAEVAQEREDGGTEAESASETQTAAEPESTTEAAAPVETKTAVRREPEQLTLRFPAGALDPKGTQLQLAFDQQQSGVKPTPPAATTTTTATTTTSTTTSTTTTTPASAPAPAAKPATQAPVPATAAAAKPGLDPVLALRKQEALRRLEKKIEELDDKIKTLEVEVQKLMEEAKSSIELARQVFQTLAAMGQAARANMR